MQTVFATRRLLWESALETLYLLVRYPPPYKRRTHKAYLYTEENPGAAGEQSRSHMFARGDNTTWKELQQPSIETTANKSQQLMLWMDSTGSKGVTIG